MKHRTKVSIAEGSGSRSFFINKSGVQIQFQALFGQKVKDCIQFHKIDSQNNTPVPNGVW